MTYRLDLTRGEYLVLLAALKAYCIIAANVLGADVEDLEGFVDKMEQMRDGLKGADDAA